MTEIQFIKVKFSAMRRGVSPSYSDHAETLYATVSFNFYSSLRLDMNCRASSRYTIVPFFRIRGGVEIYCNIKFLIGKELLQNPLTPLHHSSINTTLKSVECQSSIKRSNSNSCPSKSFVLQGTQRE